MFKLNTIRYFTLCALALCKGYASNLADDLQCTATVVTAPAPAPVPSLPIIAPAAAPHGHLYVAQGLDLGDISIANGQPVSSNSVQFVRYNYLNGHICQMHAILARDGGSITTNFNAPGWQFIHGENFKFNPTPLGRTLWNGCGIPDAYKNVNGSITYN